MYNVQCTINNVQLIILKSSNPQILKSFIFNQPDFSFYSCRESSKFTASCHYTVTRNYYQYWIISDGLSNSLGRLASNSFGNFSVCRSLPKWYRKKFRPYLFLEVGATKFESWRKIRSYPRKVGVEPAFCFCKYWECFALAVANEILGSYFYAAKCSTIAVYGKCSDWRFV